LKEKGESGQAALQRQKGNPSPRRPG